MARQQWRIRSGNLIIVVSVNGYFHEKRPVEVDAGQIGFGTEQRAHQPTIHAEIMNLAVPDGLTTDGRIVDLELNQSRPIGDWGSAGIAEDALKWEEFR